MANAKVGNVWHCDSTGSLTTEPRQLVAEVLLTTAATGDTLILRDVSNGANLLTIKGAAADSTYQYSFISSPLFFPSGIYVQELTSGANAMIVTVPARRSS